LLKIKIGIDQTVELELQELAVEIGDKYLLCSDGLSDLVSDVEILQILREQEGDIEAAVNKLVEKANEYGGLDNISVVITTIENSFAAEKSWVRKLIKSK
jgi:PPM family protein phosphatase